MDLVIKFISEFLGISYDSAEGSVAVLSILLAVYLLRVMWGMIKLLKSADEKDNKQIELENALTQLAIRSLNSYDANMKAIEANTQTIQKNNETIEQVVKVLQDIGAAYVSLTEEVKSVGQTVKDNRPILEDIKGNLLKTSKTIVLVKDSNGEVVSRFTAEPDEEGNLVIQFTSAATLDELQ